MGFYKGIVAAAGFVLVGQIGALAADTQSQYSDEAYAQARNDMFNDVPLMSVPLMLTRLNELSKRLRNGEDLVLPVVTFELAGGRSVHGSLLEYDGQSALVQSAEGEGRFPSVMLSYLKADTVQALSIHRVTDPVLSTLYDTWKPHGSVPPTRLELKRKSADLALFVSSKLGTSVQYEIAFDSLPEGTAANAVLANVLNAVTGTLSEVSASGKRAALTSLKRVVFKHAAQASIRLNAGILEVCPNLQDSPLGGISRSVLRQQIES